MEFASPNVSEHDLRAAASKHGVAHHLHEKDLLFNYFITKVYPGDYQKAVSAYFAGGQSDAMQARQSLQRFKTLDGGEPLKILEFASGYGRVARHSERAFSGHQYIASDIHPEATRFLASALGIKAAQSSHDPESLEVGKDYDCIFVLSLFSHLPDKSFGRWLSALYSILANNGVLLFTTHGGEARRKFPVPFETMLDQRKGWGFGTDSDQPDLDSGDYGTMIVTENYVMDAIRDYCPHAQLLRFDSGVWFGLQDEWLIRKCAPVFTP